VAEIEELKKEAAAFRDVRKGLNEEDGAKKTFEKVCVPIMRSTISHF
jgi:hypothetical protein